MLIALSPESILYINGRGKFYSLRLSLLAHARREAIRENPEIENMNFMEYISQQVDNKLAEDIDKYHIVNKIELFRKLLVDLRLVFKRYAFISYYLCETDLFVFGNDGEHSNERLFIRYTFENEHLFEIFKDLLRPTTTEYGYVLTLAGVDVNKIFMNPLLMELIVKCKILDSEYTPIYKQFQKRFPNGKVRILDEPNELISPVLKEFNSVLYKHYGKINNECQFAYKKGKNIVDNALPHKDHRYIFKADIEDFFPSCKRELVAKYLKRYFVNSLDPDRYLNYLLDKMLVNDALCLGNPISPVLANAIIAKPAKYIYNMCKLTGVSFTQYCDDLTFSSDRPIAKDYVVRVFNEAYGTYHLTDFFHIKQRKLIGQVGQQRNVTGIAFDHTDNNAPTPKRSMYRNLRASIHKLSLGEAVNINKIKGQIAYMAMIGKGKRILNYLEKFPNLIEQLIGPKLLEKINNTSDVREINNNNIELPF